MAGAEPDSPGLQGPALSRPVRLARGRHIISFDGLDASSRCVQFANILNALFDVYSQSESDAPRALIVVEESIRFTRKGVEKEAQPAARMAEQSLEQVARQSRKAGNDPGAPGTNCTGQI